MSENRQEEQDSQGSESLLTVVIAAAVNLVIAVAKVAAGLLSGSAAMLSEAAHSFADTATELLLVLAVRRGARPADDSHPFGHGKSAFFWALMAAGATLVVGAGFSITHGVQTILYGEELADLTVSYVVLAVAVVLETVSFLRALRQIRGEARRWRVSPRDYVAITSDTAVKAVLFEDAAALAGIVIAAGGLFGYQLTGSPLWDGAASVLIGLLLLGIALYLIRANASLLIGQAAPPMLRDAIRAELDSRPEVVETVELLTMMLGPSDILVAAKVDFGHEYTGDRLEEAADRVERAITGRWPEVSHVFLDPTPGRAARRRAAEADGGAP
ncbi:cation diffusion facilitator family transporter [Sphaerisporangium aureirubrum]|uniref:Cation diffusion facilitator family transporter n=1 Tax=Sphaerisporangium aureirubrum TaxID=1544736 RepID=A0ABW1NIV6_9ACTN